MYWRDTAWVQRYPLAPLETETILVQNNGVTQTQGNQSVWFNSNKERCQRLKTMVKFTK
jgi:hypothetical protein